MRSTDIVAGLVSTCERELARLIEDIDRAAGSGLFAIGAVAEILVLADAFEAVEDLRRLVADASARWLRSGLLEECCMSRVEFLYHAALLCYLARFSRNYRATDSAVLNRLCAGRLVGRSESPVLTQRLIGAYFKRSGLRADFGEAGERDFARMIDKRVLRPRSDEYDLLVLLMFAQLVHLGECSGPGPALCPQVLLIQSMRSQNLNWVPVLAFLSQKFFRADERLAGAAQQFLLSHLPRGGALLPAPAASGVDADFVSRGGAGIRIRSTAALICLLSTTGDIHADDRATVALG